MKVELTKSQAQVFEDLFRRKEAANKEWRTAVMLAGLDADDLVGGDLTADPPYFTVKDDGADPA